MILFIFEGSNPDTAIYNSMEYVFFGQKDTSQRIVSCYNGNIYDLYSKVVENGGDMDIVALLRDRYQKQEDCPITSDMKRSDFAEIYLFFDYDFHHSIGNVSVEEINLRVQKMLDVFNDETDNGKLYISYPMVEAIKYTKQLPDSNYHTYTASREECVHFKRDAANFSFYQNNKFFTTNSNDTDTHKDEVRKNWQLINEQNIKKANWLCYEVLAIPDKHDNEFQRNIFQAQIDNFVIPSECVSILSSYPLFLLDYFGLTKLFPAQ